MCDFDRLVPCPECGGDRGFEDAGSGKWSSCSFCDGSGEIKAEAATSEHDFENRVADIPNTMPSDGPIDPVADRILSLVRVWRDCPTEKRPSARALAERIVETVLADQRGEQ